MLYHGRPGTDYDATFWQALHALQDRIWPQMSARLEAARKLDVHWEAETTPFAWVEEQRALAHVGVIAHPLRLLGEDRVVAGIHAVCVDPGARGRGLARRCMEAALAWIDERFDLAKLSTGIPAFYARWGFSVAPTRPGSSLSAPAAAARRAPRSWMTQHGSARCSRRARQPPTSMPPANPAGCRSSTSRYSVACGTACSWFRGGISSSLRASRGTVLHLDDVVGPELPGLEEVIGRDPVPLRAGHLRLHTRPSGPGRAPRTGPRRAGGVAGPRRLAEAATLRRVLGLGTLD